MTETNAPRPRGPWDPRPDDIVAAPAAAEAAHATEPPLAKGQDPLWAALSTLLLGGLIWYWTRSFVIVGAVLWGLLVHEYGHVLAMNRFGMGPARIHVIPFFGGAAVSQRPAASEWHGVLVSLAGPAFGLLAAIPFFALFLVTRQGSWLAGAATIAALNLINLAPAPPLDGSRALGPVLARIHPMLERIALLAIGGLVVWWSLATGRWFLSVFLVIALLGHLRNAGWRPEARRLTVRESLSSVSLYIATGAACAAVGLAALIPLGGDSLTVALEVAGRYLGIGR
ncbi:Zn-dependent protease [Brevundimonas alba]|uniref:Zn-dependent protease n=1 Tax=Brevundimonas alba TaxID=74314 RepID=A0A7X5YLK8_9CAUL|nr:site-2 protease family protein [Brevundimonas alba]NJC41416.1 Zn-dependent protease [Brevundimonas alba]